MTAPESRADRIALALAVATALAVVLGGIRFGTFAAADTDPYGYVSQADLIAAGRLRIDQSFARSLPWIEAEESMTPPGYRLGADKRFIVPMYGSGLPALMAAAQRLSGQRVAAFYVVPVLGALAVLATYWLGARWHSRRVGVVAALFLATGPVFLYQLPQPVSDVPATAWWAAALALALGNSRWSAAGAGVAASLGIATRLNLAPLAVAIGVYLLWTAWRSDAGGRRASIERVAFFVAGLMPVCVAVGVINNHLHGSPLTSGYGSASEYFRLEHVAPNLDRYPRWLLTTETPLVLLALAAPLLASVRGGGANPRRAAAWLLLSFVTILFVMCIFYGYFGRDEWVYLRLLMPAYPALFVLTAAALDDLLSRTLTRRPRTAAAVMLVVCGAFAGWHLIEAVRRGAFDTRRVERRYIDVGRQIAATLPGNALFVTGIHAGSVRYYSGTQTMYFPKLYRRALDQAIATFEGMGYDAFILLEEGEQEHFRARFGENSALAALDWPPRYETPDGIRVRIWDPADRERHQRGETIRTEPIAAWHR